jgi:monothiol glutaredoxin
MQRQLFGKVASRTCQLLAVARPALSVIPAQRSGLVYRTQMRQFGSDSSHNDFEPKTKAPMTTEQLTEQFDKWINDNDVVVFMKGTRKMPQCGFSRLVVVMLQTYGVKQFKDVNVLADDSIRHQIKEYSQWPTIPQVYIKQQFIGGCDIMKEMHEDGSLRELLIREELIKE